MHTMANSTLYEPCRPAAGLGSSFDSCLGLHVFEEWINQFYPCDNTSYCTSLLSYLNEDIPRYC